MPFLDRVRALLSSPADRRLAAAAAEAFTSAPAPVVASPFAPGQQPPARVPTPAWNTDQPPPPPERPAFVGGYHDHTFQSFSAPLSFDGWDVERIRTAISQHRQGIFLESSTLAVAILGFAPVLAALGQAVAPALHLDRHIRGGSRGLARLVASELEDQLVPRAGLLPSPYFPPTLWGSIAIDLRLPGFAVLQHVDGDPDPVTGIRPRYTRRWPTWAVQNYRYRRTFVAITTEGPVDILNDGKFTLIADEEEPHLTGAIAALGEEVLSGQSTRRARDAWIDRYGQPKWVGIMPEKIGMLTPEGEAFFQALSTITGPQGVGALPFGSKFETVGLGGEASGSFREALDNVIIHIAMALLGSDGTIRAGGEGAAGPYRSPMFQGVRRDLVARMLAAMVRGVNQGHIAPYCDFNYASGIEAARARGQWVDPVLDIPLPDPDADARIKSSIDRQRALYDVIKSEREVQGVVDQERVNALAARFDADPFVLAEQAPKAGEIFSYHIDSKIVSPDEVRERIGLDPLPDGAGSVKRLAKERLAGKDETGGAPSPETNDQQSESEAA